MPADFAAVFASLKPVLTEHAKLLAVKTDTPLEYALVTKSASPFPQHKGHPLDFASVRLGKAYVSFHLMLIYMCPELSKTISPALQKRMQGKTLLQLQDGTGGGTDRRAEAADRGGVPAVEGKEMGVSYTPGDSFRS